MGKYLLVYKYKQNIIPLKIWIKYFHMKWIAQNDI